MIELPARVHEDYRAADSAAVRAWSYGSVSAATAADPTAWRENRGSLADPKIFGPLFDFVCACGKYAGAQHKGVICDVCGVTLCSSGEARRKRCGHLNLFVPLSHPTVPSEKPLDAFPVVPAAHFDSRGGAPLREAYERLIGANRMELEGVLLACVGDVLRTLLPAFLLAHDWDLTDAEVLARGLALEKRSR